MLSYIFLLLAGPSLLENRSEAFTTQQRTTSIHHLPASSQDQNQADYGDYESTSMEDFMRDLRDAKASKLGGAIPEEQLKESAARAESDFLQAMKETKEEFDQAKKELGSEGAVDMFLDKIRKEDEHRGGSAGSSSSSCSKNCG
jgi:hypothetical protein